MMHVVYISGNVEVWAQWCIAIPGGFISILLQYHRAGFFLEVCDSKPIIKGA